MQMTPEYRYGVKPASLEDVNDVTAGQYDYRVTVLTNFPVCLAV